MAGPLFPDVPRALGVPPINRDLSNLGTGTIPALSKDEITANGNDGDRWGIYDGDGNAVLEPDTVVAIGYSAEHRIADFPIEEGGFETYDKVALPFDARVIMSKGGKFADRRAFIAALEDIRGNRELYSVVTPERTWLKANIYRISIDRSRENGAGLITAEIMLREIRENVTAEFSNTKEAASADQKNAGSVQAKPATADTASLPPRPDIANAPSLDAKVAASLKKLDGALQIPALKVPSQKLTVQLGKQLAEISLTAKRTGLFLDLVSNGSTIAQGVKCLDRAWVLGSKASGFLGNLAFIDTRGQTDPTYDNLASRFQLIWSGI